MEKIDAIRKICDNDYLTELGRIEYIRLIVMDIKPPEEVLHEIYLSLRCIILN